MLVLVISQLPAQKIINYNQSGDKTKTLSEFVEISLKSSIEKNGVAPAAIVGVVLGPLYDIVSGIIKDKLEKRQKSFVASYSNSNEFSKVDLNDGIPTELTVKRYAMNNLDELERDPKPLMSEYTFSVTPSGNDVLIELINITLNQSKARYKENDDLAISISVKSKVTVTTAADPKTIESDGTFLVPIIGVGGGAQDFSKRGKIVGKMILKNVDLAKLSTINFAVTVTETNIKRADPGIVQQILTNNSKEIQSILKELFGEKKDE